MFWLLEVVKALLEHLKAEQSVFRSKIEDIQMNLTSPSLKVIQDSQGNVINRIRYETVDGIQFKIE
jgi:hypothetical protein